MKNGQGSYDIDGKLIGNWFLEGTNGYAGPTDTSAQFTYWKGHLAVFYNFIEPSQVDMSFGDWDGKPLQFTVKSGPDPNTVGVEDGLVKYELAPYPSNHAPNYSAPDGVVLYQLLEDRKLKVQTFSNMRVEQVGGFTEDALIYVR